MVRKLNKRWYSSCIPLWSITNVPIALNIKIEHWTVKSALGVICLNTVHTGHTPIYKYNIVHVFHWSRFLFSLCWLCFVQLHLWLLRRRRIITTLNYTEICQNSPPTLYFPLMESLENSLRLNWFPHQCAGFTLIYYNVISN